MRARVMSLVFAAALAIVAGHRTPLHAQETPQKGAARTLLGDFARLTARQYGVGTGTQPDVLKAQVERTRLDEQLVELHPQRAEVAARLNALLGRPTDAPLPSPEIVSAMVADYKEELRRKEAILLHLQAKIQTSEE